MSFNHKSMHSQHKMMFKNYYITSNNQQKEHKFTQKILSLFPDDNNSRIRPMPEDSFCIQYKNCTGCPRAIIVLNKSALDNNLSAGIR